MKSAWLVGWFVLFAATVQAAEIFEPAATPTPDTDSVRSYIVARVYWAVPIRRPAPVVGVFQDATVRIDLIGLRADGTCARVNASGECRMVTKEYPPATSLTLLRVLNTADMSQPGQSLNNRILQFMLSRGDLPAGTVTGVPGIDAAP